jgi:hypothetical protein
VATIYLSSTYADLEEHREAVYKQLRSMKHTVTAMEDDVARDDRPADRCVRDVADSDLYVGLVAWRYGYIPTTGNPESLSVTELEYRAAGEHGITRLVFLLDVNAAWSPKLIDACTGEGNRGALIGAFRERLARVHLVSFFTGPDDLAAKVGAAVHVAGSVTEATDASLDFAAVVGDDAIDHPEMLFSESYLHYLIQKFAGLHESPLLKIDLRDGKYWWSTRLYAVATLANDYTSVEWLLFLDRGTDYVGMVRPGHLRRALALAQPELDEYYQLANAQRSPPGTDGAQRAARVLTTFVSGFAARPGGEEGFRFLVDAAWVTRNVAGLSTVKVERSGPFDPLATHQLLQAGTPFVPVTERSRLLKVIDRVGVATALALTMVERRLGRV